MFVPCTYIYSICVYINVCVYSICVYINACVCVYTGLVTQSVLHTPAGSEAAVEEGHEGGGGSGSEEMRKRLQQEARFAANRVFR